MGEIRAGKGVVCKTKGCRVRIHDNQNGRSSVVVNEINFGGASELALESTLDK